MTESVHYADLKQSIQNKANALNLGFGTMFGAYAGAVFSFRINEITLDILQIIILLIIIAHITTSPATTHPRKYRRKWWIAERVGDWVMALGAPFVWYFATGRFDLGSIILFAWIVLANIVSAVYRKRLSNQRRIDIENRRWIMRLDRKNRRHSVAK